MKRVVLCPYLAAMWASMAPLYAEHVAAGDAVTVMSLPYGIRDPEGNVSAYRRDSGYPVETEKADIDVLRNMRPDRIYFHNPYDYNNTITQIHPNYHSKQLAQCTDDLVYVPYYTMPESPGGDVEYIITAPGVLRANHIIVYSKESKETFFNVLGKHSVDWKDRIIVKQRPQPRHYTKPLEWMLAAKNRKLIMLGTSLSALINRREEELARITKAIVDHQNNSCCLVWRPHPLYDAALIAMYPYLRSMYRDIVHHYIEYEQGILDESWDVERAVALCEEYIGDPSSVAGMFREQGKPVQYI